LDGTKYLKQYNEYPSFYELNAFGEVLVIAQAINLAQSDNPKSVTKALSRELSQIGVVK
jgi:hypothetical protein